MTTTDRLIGHPDELRAALVRQRDLGQVIDAYPIGRYADGRMEVQLVRPGTTPATLTPLAATTPAPSAASPTSMPYKTFALFGGGVTALGLAGWAIYEAYLWCAAHWAALLGGVVTVALLLALLADVAGEAGMVLVRGRIVKDS